MTLLCSVSRRNSTAQLRVATQKRKGERRREQTTVLSARYIVAINQKSRGGSRHKLQHLIDFWHCNRIATNATTTSGSSTDRQETGLKTPSLSIPPLSTSLSLSLRTMAMIYAALSTYLSCANASYDEQRFEIRSQQQEKQQEEEAKPQQRGRRMRKK